VFTLLSRNDGVACSTPIIVSLGVLIGSTQNGLAAIFTAQVMFFSSHQSTFNHTSQIALGFGKLSFAIWNSQGFSCCTGCVVLFTSTISL
jgi:hypothetical protein